MNTFTERRKYKRIKESLPVEYKVFNDENSWDVSHSVDIGGKGACFMSTKFVQKSHRLVLAFHIPGKEKPVKVISKVAWMRKDKDDRYYKIGVQFVTLSKADLKAINVFIDK